MSYKRNTEDNELVIQPNELQFDLNETEPSTVLTLKNNSEQQKAFKVKTTQPKRYLVRPNQDVLNPGDSLEIKISLQAREAASLKIGYYDDPDSITDVPDKFLIQSSVIPDEFIDLLGKHREEATNKSMSEILAPLWKQTDITTMACVRLKCKFFPPTNDNMGDMQPANKNENVADLRKKYNELLMFTVQLTSERDRLREDCEQKIKELTDLKKKSFPALDDNEPSQSVRTGFALWQVIFVALLSFVATYFMNNFGLLDSKQSKK